MVLTTFVHNANLHNSKYAPACVCIPSFLDESGKSFAPGAFRFMEQEIWKDIVCYEGLYQISNLGRVKRLPFCITDKIGKTSRDRNYPGGILIPVAAWRKNRPKEENNNYMIVQLCKDSKARPAKIHRLVAIHFVPNPENKPQVNHKDGKKYNNKVINLEWSTGSENQIHAINTGLRTNKGNYKTWNDVPVIIYKNAAIVYKAKSFASAARFLGCKSSAIRRVAMGERNHYKGHKIYLATQQQDQIIVERYSAVERSVASKAKSGNRKLRTK